MSKTTFKRVILISALTSTIPKNESLGDWMVMYKFGGESGSVPCPFRHLRSSGEYDYIYILKNCNNAIS